MAANLRKVDSSSTPKTYLFEYWFQGSRYGFEIVAETESEAWWRLGQMQDAELVGTKVFEIAL